MIVLPIVLIIFFILPAFSSGLITQNIANDCGNTYSYSAIFEPIVYNCANGYFLPAGAISCATCPSGYTCPGGEYSFSATNTQGIAEGDILVQDAIGSCSAGFSQSLTAIFEPIVYTCSAGFYLPAGNDWQNDTEGCRKCQENNYCPGGAYTFNETIAQGITICPDGMFAAVGMWNESQCGRRLYVAGEYLYLHKSPATPTPHRLYVRVNETVYSANTTPISESPDLKMSANAQRALHVKIDGIEYLIHDDSVK